MDKHTRRKLRRLKQATKFIFGKAKSRFAVGDQIVGYRSGAFGENEVFLNEDLAEAIYETYTTDFGITKSRQAAFDILFQADPEITIGKKFSLLAGMKSGRRLEKSIEEAMMHHNKRFLRDVFDWKKMFGIVPYYIKKDRKTKLPYPAVPPFYTGWITVSWNMDKKEKRYKWYWFGLGTYGTNHDRNMKFLYFTEPDIHGRITTSIASYLPDRDLDMVLIDTQQKVALSYANPQHVYEYTPPADKTGDLTAPPGADTGFSSSSEILMDRIRPFEGPSEFVSSDMDRSHLKKLEEYSVQASRMRTVYRSEKQLPPYVKLVPEPTRPTVPNWLEHHDTTQIKASSIMGFPLSLIGVGNRGKYATDFASLSDWTNRTLTREAADLSEALQIAYTESWEKFFRMRKNKTIKAAQKKLARPLKLDEIALIDKSVEVTVNLLIKPMVDPTQLRQFWLDSCINKKTYSTLMASKIGIPETQLETKEIVSPSAIAKANFNIKDSETESIKLAEIKEKGKIDKQLGKMQQDAAEKMAKTQQKIKPDDSSSITPSETTSEEMKESKEKTPQKKSKAKGKTSKGKLTKSKTGKKRKSDSEKVSRKKNKK